MSRRRYQSLRGMKDLLPADTPRWQAVEAAARASFARYGFREIRTPLVEPTELFTRSVGEASDIVNKEMYTFEVSGESVCLRPENTASVVRAVIQHSLQRDVATGYPERLYYIGPMFRHERPQKGRQRQFHQIGAEVLGGSEPLIDAETIAMVDGLLRAVGIDDHELVLNAVGDGECRPSYRRELVDWLQPRLDALCEDCNRRAADNPLRVFDCKREADRELLREAPTMRGSMCRACGEHFEAVCGWLERFGVSFRDDPRMVRGLDYYQRTVFEFVNARLGAQDAILGGGRYDGLAEALGGPALPGFGFALGVERLLLLAAGSLGERDAYDVAVVGLGEAGWLAAVEITAELRAAGVRCLLPAVERPMGAQMRRADRAGARRALFVGEDELAAGRFGVKDLRSGEQRALTRDALAGHLLGDDRGDR